MSHFITLVFTKENGKSVEELLAPFDENIEYAPYVKYTAITFEYDVPSVEEFRQRIVNISDRYPYIKAVDNGQIAGYAYAGCFKDRRAWRRTGRSLGINI